MKKLILIVTLLVMYSCNKDEGWCYCDLKTMSSVEEGMITTEKYTRQYFKRRATKKCNEWQAEENAKHKLNHTGYEPLVGIPVSSCYIE